jgi:hypothetical protein
MKKERDAAGMKKESRAARDPGIGAIYCYRVWDEVPPQ